MEFRQAAVDVLLGWFVDKKDVSHKTNLGNQKHNEQIGAELLK